MPNVRNIVIPLATLALLWLTSGCSSGPRAQPIDLPTEALLSATEDAAQDPRITYTEILPSDWWTLFNDDQLTAFIQTAFERNPTLQEARANILLAYYNADKVRSTLYPNINWGADVLREKLSETGIIPFNTKGQLTGIPPPVSPASRGSPFISRNMRPSSSSLTTLIYGERTAARYALFWAMSRRILPTRYLHVCSWVSLLHRPTSSCKSYMHGKRLHIPKLQFATNYYR